MAVSLHDRFLEQKWLSTGGRDEYNLTAAGREALEVLGFDIAATLKIAPPVAYACLALEKSGGLHIGGGVGRVPLESCAEKKMAGPGS